MSDDSWQVICPYCTQKTTIKGLNFSKYASSLMAGTVKELQEENAKLKKQLEASENKWSELANHLNPYNYKPLYWDYKTARNIIAAMKDIEALNG